MLTLFSYMIIIFAHRKPKLQLRMILHVVIETYINKIINVMGNIASLQLCTISFLPVTTLFVFADNSQINFFKMRISRFEFKKFAVWKNVCTRKTYMYVKPVWGSMNGFPIFYFQYMGTNFESDIGKICVGITHVIK